MRVSSTLTVYSPANTRSEQLQGRRPRDDGLAQRESTVLESIGQETVRRAQVPPVIATSELSDVVSQKKTLPVVDKQLPLNTHRALKAFINNSPSPEQQLGIELAGIDVFI